MDTQDMIDKLLHERLKAYSHMSDSDDVEEDGEELESQNTVTVQLTFELPVPSGASREEVRELARGVFPGASDDETASLAIGSKSPTCEEPDFQKHRSEIKAFVEEKVDQIGVHHTARLIGNAVADKVWFYREEHTGGMLPLTVRCRDAANEVAYYAEAALGMDDPPTWYDKPVPEVDSPTEDCEGR